MKWIDISESSKYNDAPEQGQILAYTREKVIFQAYKKSELKGLFGEMDIVEIHLFDQEKEYRAILSNSRKSRAKGRKFIDCIVKKESKESCLYEKKYLLDPKYKKEGRYIMVANHLAYDKDGMAYIDNYRLVMPRKGE